MATIPGWVYIVGSIIMALWILFFIIGYFRMWWPWKRQVFEKPPKYKPVKLFLYAREGKHGLETFVSESARYLSDPYKAQLRAFMESTITEISTELGAVELAERKKPLKGVKQNA